MNSDQRACAICGFQHGGAEPGSRYCTSCTSAPSRTKSPAEQLRDLPTVNAIDTSTRRERASRMEMVAAVAVTGIGVLDRGAREIERILETRSASDRLARAGRYTTRLLRRPFDRRRTTAA